MSNEESQQASGGAYWQSPPIVPAGPSSLEPTSLDADTFRLLADNLPALCWIGREDGSVVWYNRRWREYCGTAPARIEGWGWPAVHDPLVLPSVMERWAVFIAASQPFEMTYSLLGADGQLRPFLTRVAPVRDASRQLTHWLGVSTDISGCAEAERPLHHTRAAAKGLAAEQAVALGQLAEGVVVADRAGQIVFVNAAAARIHGVEQLGVSPEGYSDTYHLFTDDGRPYPSTELPLARAVLRGETVTEERWRIRRPDGSEVLAVGSARPVLDDEGSPSGAVLTLRDETARLAAEQAERESEGRLRALADNLPNGMVYQIAMQRDGSARRFVYVSGSCERLTGVSAEAALADPMALYEAVDFEDRATLAAVEEDAIRDLTHFEHEVRLLRTGDSEVRWCRLISGPREMPDGSLVWDGLLVDVTQHRRTEEDLRKSEAVKGAVVEGALDCVVTVDHHGRILEWNPAAEQTFGHARKAALGRNLADLIVPPEQREAHRRGFQRYLQTGEGTLVGRRIEVQAMRADGSTFPSELAITPTSVAGRTLMTAYLRDITERRQAEQRQELLVAELNHRVKNVLATVQAVADQTLRGSGGDPTRFAQPFLERLRALARAHDLLTERRWEPTDAGEVVRAALLPWLAGGTSDGRVSFSSEAGTAALVSPRQAQSLVLGLHELVTNATKYGALSCPEGHVDVRCGTGAGGVLVVTWKEIGGPPVVPPSRKGFGTRLLQRGLTQDLGPGASVDLQFNGAGLRGVVCFVPLGREP
ncbi:PAS domain S-box protein [Roseomonas sp. GCM10028921]